jgi:hypothetical protein
MRERRNVYAIELDKDVLCEAKFKKINHIESSIAKAKIALLDS